MKLIKTSAPTGIQLKELDDLAGRCRLHDKIRLSYPATEQGDGCRHFLLYDEHGSLTAALALLELDQELSECIAFTHPAHRRRGYFTLLLDAALEDNGERDILFAVCENCADTMAVLDSLGAELESREHQMELTIREHHAPCSAGTRSDHTGSVIHPEVTIRQLDDSAWELAEQGQVIGHGMLTPVSDSCACLHHVEIREDLRGKGYGSDFLTLLLPRLASAGIRKVILQVSGGNPAALSLYRKTGFRLTETLSYYWY